MVEQTQEQILTEVNTNKGVDVQKLFSIILSPENEHTPSSLLVRQLHEQGVIQFKKSTNHHKCKYCQDSGKILEPRFEPEAVYEYEVAVPCPICEGKGLNSDGETVKAKMKHAGIPSIFSGKLLHDINWGIWGTQSAEIPELKETVEDFIENFDLWAKSGKGLYFYSKCKGSGKTFISAVVANELIKRGINVKFVRSADLLNLATDSSKANRGEITVIERIKSVKLLILDDLGEKRAGKDFFADVLFDLLDYRITAGSQTIITSNFRISELPFDDWLLSRVNKACISLSFPEASIRTIEAKKELADFKKAIHERQTRKRGA